MRADFFTWGRRLAGGVVLAVVAASAAAQGRDFIPESDAAVIETVPAKPAGRPAATSTDAASPDQAAATARHWLDASRTSAEPRYLGRAQAVLAPWWDKPDAPAPLAILQATIQQRQHRFAEARQVLERVLKRDPSQAQAWLTLAALERLAGRYPQSLAACGGVARNGPALYAQACRLEVQSLTGQADVARAGFSTLLRSAGSNEQRAWLLSLFGESEERAGRDADALKAFDASLKFDADPYTAVARADLLLRTGRPQPALDGLVNQPPSLAVLLRRARAMKQLGNPGWQPLAAQLRSIFTEQRLRGDAPELEARERALADWWLDDNLARAADAARLNLQHQKEPIDWWLALTTARGADLAALTTQFRQSGLTDARLAAFAKP